MVTGYNWLFNPFSNNSNHHLSGTENAIEGARNFGTNFLEKLSAASPSDTAVAIIKGSSLQYRELFFPYMEARFSTLFRDWVIDPLEGYIRYLYATT